MSVAQPDAASAEPHRFESIEGAFAALESPLLIYALRLLPNRAAAEDIVQEAFMKLHGQFKEVREPRRWLYRTVHNLALNYRRKTDRLVPLEPTASPGSSGVGSGSGPGGHHETADPDLLPDEQIVRWEGIGLVRLSLGALDERSLAVARGLGAIAAELGRPAAQVALNWLRAQPGVLLVLGARTAAQLDDNLACLDFTLAPGDLARLDALRPIRLGYPHDYLSRTRSIAHAGFDKALDA